MASQHGPDGFEEEATNSDKAAYAARVKSVMRSRRAQTVAKNCAAKFRKACQQVVDRKGAAADN